MNRIVSVIVATLLILVVLFGSLSYSFYSEKSVIQKKYEKLAETNNELVERLETREKSAKIDDKFIIESIQTNDSLSGIERDTLTKIERIEQNRSLKTDAGENENEQTKKNVVSINDKLPDDISNVLREHYNSLQRESGGDSTAR